MHQLVVATGNPGKLKEMQAYLTGLNWELILKPDELEIEETGETFAENACLKASQIALATGKWAIADDSGLEVDALNGVPGVYSARYGATDSDRIHRLLKELGDNQNRKAQFVCVVALAKPNGAIAIQSTGICVGTILDKPCGEGGFGYDPIFYVPKQQLTYAQMTREVKREVSHRGKAFADLIPKLSNLVLDQPKNHE